jgi:uncharacterized metal-binding protein YceD (DUF177 family)
MKQFVIPIAGLKAGNHNFAFDIDDRFFEHFEYSEISRGTIRVECLMEKQQRMMIFHFAFDGQVTVACDRCADDLLQPLHGEERLIVKLGTEHGEESDDILVITEHEHEVDLAQFLYEYIHLLLPMKRVHGNDADGRSLCNPEVIRFITGDEDTTTDPRWEALKKIRKDFDEQEN